jgi:membrane-associated phospholipid phosphatase
VARYDGFQKSTIRIALPVSAYLSYGYQFVAVFVVLAITLRSNDLREFMRIFMSNVIIVVLFPALFPASNPSIHFGIVGHHAASPWSTFYALRDGLVNLLDVDVAQGIVSFPSLHAAQAVLFAYSVRHIRWLFPIAAVLNLIMIYSALPFGAHYLVDIIAGIALSVALIGFYRLAWRRRHMLES